MDNKSIEWINSLLQQLQSVNEKEGKIIMEGCGRTCASSHDLQIDAKAVRDSVEDKTDDDLLFNTYKEKEYNTPRLWKEGNQIYLEYHACGCPLVKSGGIKTHSL